MNKVVLLLWMLQPLTYLNLIQCEKTFPLLQSRHEASVVDLLCTLLDSRGRGLLQLFCPTFATAPLTHSYCLGSLNDVPLLLSSPFQFKSLDLFKRSFLGVIADIWVSTPLDIRY